MEIHYWNPTREEAEEFETYCFDEDTESLVKVAIPDYCRIPSENPDTIKKAKHWFNISNREDLYVLSMEEHAFNAYFKKEFNQIKKHLE